MDYEQTLLFFTVVTIIRVILYKSKYFLKIFPDLLFPSSPISRAKPDVHLNCIFGAHIKIHQILSPSSPLPLFSLTWIWGLLLYILKVELQT